MEREREREASVICDERGVTGNSKWDTMRREYERLLVC